MRVQLDTGVPFAHVGFNAKPEPPVKYRRQQLCQLAGIDPERFKTLRHRHQLAIYWDRESDPDGIIIRDVDKLEADDERRGHGRFRFCDAVMLDVQLRLAGQGLSLERAALVARGANNASARLFNNAYAWVEFARSPGLFLVQRTEDINGELWDTGAWMGRLDHVNDFLAKAEAPLAMATVVNLSLSFDRVLARARAHGIKTRFDEDEHDR